jgi:hypothetical protein
VNIWLVFGSTGEYSDRTEWVVEAHRTEAAAQARVTELTTLMQELGAGSGGHPGWQERQVWVNAMQAHPRGDPSYSEDNTGTTYYPAGPIPLKRARKP